MPHEDIRREESPSFVYEIPRREKEEGGFVGKVQRLFEDAYARKELPEVKFLLFYSGHTLAGDKKKIWEHMKKADIFVRETPGWRPLVLEELRMVARREILPKEVLRLNGIDIRSHEYPMLLDELESIYQTQIPLVFIDVPEGSHIYERLVRALIHLPNHDILGLSFFEILERTKGAVLEYSKAQKARDEYILTQLIPGIKKAIKEYPELGNRSSLAVLIELGSLHTPIYHALYDGGIATKRDFDIMPHVYDFPSELFRRYAFGKEVNDEIVARAAFEFVIFSCIKDRLRKFTENSSDIVMWYRKVVGAFNYDEIRLIFESSDSADAFMNIFETRLKEKHIRFPHSRNDFRSLLRK